MSTLLPVGCRSFADAPYNLVDAINLALGFLSFEELPQEEKPPKRIWLDEDAMTSWWSEIKRRREARAKGEEPDDGGPMVENAGARDLIVG